jgi:hypothetical protein
VVTCWGCNNGFIIYVNTALTVVIGSIRYECESHDRLCASKDSNVQ